MYMQSSIDNMIHEGWKETIKCCSIHDKQTLLTFTTNTTCQLQITRENRYSFGMDRTQVTIFKQTHQICLTGFLKCQDGRSLETKIGLEILGNFTYQTLEWKFADQEFRGFLVASNFTKSNRTRSIAMRFLDTAS